jgi:hypothetical protein
MINLTSFEFHYASPDEVTVRQLLNFFESTPRLRTVYLRCVTPTPCAQDGRLVSLACLEKMEITDGSSACLLLDHILIPVGAYLTIEVALPCPPVKDHPPRFLDNLGNLSNFTAIELSCDSTREKHMRFSGPNGQVRIIPHSYLPDETYSVLGSLDHFDTSKAEQLNIDRGNSSSSDQLYRALLPMKHLRTLTFRACLTPHVFIHALHPDMTSSGVVVCPKLEELVIVLDWIPLDMESVIGVVAARASRGANLKSVRIIGQHKFERADVLELKKHVLHVECGLEVDRTNDDSEYMDEKD